MRVIGINKDGTWARLRFRTTWKNSWSMMLGYAAVIAEYSTNVGVLTAKVAGDEPVAADVKSVNAMFGLPEQGVLVIRGNNKIYDQMPMQFMFFNQLDEAIIDVKQDYLEWLNKDREEADREEAQLHTFDKLMDSIEIKGCIRDELRTTVPKVLNAYTAALKQYARLGDKDDNLVFGWDGFRFPLEETVSTVRDIDFVYEKDDGDFLAVSPETMALAQKLLSNIVRMKRNPDSRNMIDVTFYNGMECKDDEHYLAIGTPEWEAKAAENREKNVTTTTQYNLKKQIRSSCPTCPAANGGCRYGGHCPKVLAAYLFYLQKVGMYNARMAQWVEANQVPKAARREPDPLEGRTVVSHVLAISPDSDTDLLKFMLDDGSVIEAYGAASGDANDKGMLFGVNRDEMYHADGGGRRHIEGGELDRIVKKAEEYAKAKIKFNVLFV